MPRPKDWKPDFRNLELILRKKPAPRPVMFDFIIGEEKEKMLLGGIRRTGTELDRVISNLQAFEAAGFDHASIVVRGLTFPRKTDEHQGAKTKSLNEGATIVDWKTFSEYPWPEISACDFSILAEAGKRLSQGVRFIPFSLDGILENAIGIMGYENLCLSLYDDPELVAAVFQNVGRRIDQYFTECLKHPEVGAILCNDDWGFNTQTMIAPDLLRIHVFPWYKKIVEKAHACGKYAILHSCGYFRGIAEDIVQDMKFDGRHSYEDKIMPVEEAYEFFHPRLAVMGGMDVDFLARSMPEAIRDRVRKMLDRTAARGGYALGSGNSIPDYIPNENYSAMLEAAYETGRKR